MAVKLMTLATAYRKANKLECAYPDLKAHVIEDEQLRTIDPTYRFYLIATPRSLEHRPYNHFYSFNGTTWYMIPDPLMKVRKQRSAFTI